MALRRQSRPRRPGSALAGLSTLIAVPALSGCLYLPSTVAGLPSGGPWAGLPVHAWVSEGEVRAEAITACFAPDCEPRVGVGVFRATGAEARTIAAVLRDPERVLRVVERRLGSIPGRAAAKRTAASVTALGNGELAGFVVTLMRADGTRPAHIAALGVSRGEEVRLVIAVGESLDGVRMIAGQAAAKLR